MFPHKALASYMFPVEAYYSGDGSGSQGRSRRQGVLGQGERRWGRDGGGGEGGRVGEGGRGGGGGMMMNSG